MGTIPMCPRLDRPNPIACKSLGPTSCQELLEQAAQTAFEDTVIDLLSVAWPPTASATQH